MPTSAQLGLGHQMLPNTSRGKGFQKQTHRTQRKKTTGLETSGEAKLRCRHARRQGNYYNLFLYHIRLIVYGDVVLQLFSINGMLFKGNRSSRSHFS